MASPLSMLAKINGKQINLIEVLAKKANIEFFDLTIIDHAGILDDIDPCEGISQFFKKIDNLLKENGLQPEPWKRRKQEGSGDDPQYYEYYNGFVALGFAIKDPLTGERL